MEAKRILLEVQDALVERDELVRVREQQHGGLLGEDLLGLEVQLGAFGLVEGGLRLLDQVVIGLVAPLGAVVG